MRYLRLSTIRGKLLALIAGALLLAQLVSGGLSAWQEAERYAAQKSETLIAIAQILAAASAHSVADHDAAGVYKAIRATGRIRGVSYVQVLGRDGRLLADLGEARSLSTDIAIDPSSPNLPIAGLLTSRTVEVVVPIVQGGIEVGALHMIADTKDLPARLGTAMGIAAFGGLAGLILALALALRLQKRITGPLRRLTLAMSDVRTRQDYSVSLASNSTDEVGILIGGFNTMIHDIQDRDQRLTQHLERLEQEVADRTRDFRAAAAEAQAANSAKSDFLATMSHEIRTPMNGILVMAELLAKTELPSRARRHADVIAKSGKGLLAIINDILDLSKIEAGRLDVETLDVEPVEAGETVLRLFAARARSKNLDLAARILIPPGALVIADPVRLGQVLSNLVNNALKFTAAGSVTLEIAPDLKSSGRLRFSVVDTGIGIEQDKLVSIFDAFSQADQTTTRHFGGTGLGLAIGKRLVAAMGGDLEVESTPGQGSRFCFSLPISPRSRTHAPARAPGKTQVALICLPGPSTAASAALYLGEIGFEAALAESGAALASAEAAGLVLTTPEALRAQSRRMAPEPAVILALADDSAPSDDLLRQGLADFVLNAPLSRAEVHAVGEWLAAGRPARRDLLAPEAEDLPQFPNARVLVADDSEVNLEVATAALAQFGVSPTTVTNGREAVDAQLAGDFDIVFMDGSMPEMDGFEAAQAIRAVEAREGRSRRPIIALTAHVVGAAAEAWRAADMDGVLHKPFTLAKLAEILSRHLQAGASAHKETDEARQATKEGAAPKLLDPAALEDLRAMSRDPDLVGRIARLYNSTAPQRIAELREAVGGADSRRTAKAAHALKSMSLNIGAQAVAALAAKIERDAIEDANPLDRPDVEQLASLAEETYALLRSFAA